MNDPFDSTASTQADPLIGAVLDQRIEIISFLGKGASGSVYKALHKLLEQTVAVKIIDQRLLDSEIAAKRFFNEAQLLGSFAHENIVKFYSFGSLPDGRCYMVLEYLEGKTLDQILQESGAMKSEEALPLFMQICTALSYAHARGVIHRDIKPANVMILPGNEAEGESVKILDFGIFKAADGEGQKLTQTGLMLGSVNYMSPEQCKAQSLNSKSDIYSLGCLMYETLVGQAPMQDQNDMLTMSNHVNKIPSSLPAKYGSSKALQAAVLSCLKKDPLERPDADVLFAVLKNCLAAGSGKNIPETRTKALAAVLILGCFLACAGGLYLYFSKPHLSTKSAHAEKTELERRANSVPSNNAELAETEDWLLLYAGRPDSQPMTLSRVYIYCMKYRLQKRIAGKPKCTATIQARLNTAVLDGNGKLCLPIFLFRSGKNEDGIQAMSRLFKEHPENENVNCFAFSMALEAATKLKKSSPNLEGELLKLYSEYAAMEQSPLVKTEYLLKKAQYEFSQQKITEAKADLHKSCEELFSYLQNIKGVDKDQITASLSWEHYQLLNQLEDWKSTSSLFERQFSDVSKLNIDKVATSESNGEPGLEIGSILYETAIAYLHQNAFTHCLRVSKALRDQWLAKFPQSDLSDRAEVICLQALTGSDANANSIGKEAGNYLKKVRLCAPARFGQSANIMADSLTKLQKTNFAVLREVASWLTSNPDISPAQRRHFGLWLIDSDIVNEPTITAVYQELDQANPSPDDLVHICNQFARFNITQKKFELAKVSLERASAVKRDSISKSNAFDREFYKASLLAEKSEHHSAEALQKLQSLFDKNTGKEISELLTYFVLVQYLAKEYRLEGRSEDAARVLEAAKLRVYAFRSTSLVEKLVVNKDLLLLYQELDRTTEARKCAEEIKRVEGAIEQLKPLKDKWKMKVSSES